MGELDRESSTHRSGTAGDMHEVKDYKRAERVSTTGQNKETSVRKRNKSSAISFRMSGSRRSLLDYCCGSSATGSTTHRPNMQQISRDFRALTREQNHKNQQAMPRLTCFASLRLVPNGLLALLAVSQPLDESIQWLSLELSLIDKVARNIQQSRQDKR